MVRHPRSVDDAIARFDDLARRMDGGSPAAATARRRHYSRAVRSAGRRIRNMALAFIALMVVTVVLGLMLNGIGLTGLFAVAVATLLIVVAFSMWPSREAERPKIDDSVPTPDIVRQLDTFLVQQRPALPAPAARRIDAISAQLPLLESRLGSLDALDPIAQDARRLMGRHLPELIERYERVPAPFRHERDGEGLTVDERLVAGLDAAKSALDDIGSRLVRDDRIALETQGRFLESRYGDKDADL